MNKKILFIFGGTGDTAKNLQKRDADEKFADDVVRIYFNGNQDTRIGGAGGLLGIAPDLDVVASKIRSCFGSGGELSITKLKMQFGDALLVKGTSEDKVTASNINLTGFSRGAVTTFAVARSLDDLGISMSLFAQEPVPGNSKYYAKRASSEFHKNKDLSRCVNLRSAEVVLGVYSKDNTSLQNKFFRQMAPTFNPAVCTSSIYSLPKSEHMEVNFSAENHRMSFYDKTGIRTRERIYRQEITSNLFFIPKIAQQKFHEGVYGRTQLSPRYKSLLLDELIKSGKTTTVDMSVKYGQALLALGKCSTFIKATEELERRIKTDSSNEGKALREFIVEFENINQYTFKGINDKKQLYAINLFRGSVYDLIKDYPIKDATTQQKQELVKAILEEVSFLKDQIGNKELGKLRILMNDFLENNILLHPDLAKYIDETENYSGPKAISPESVARATADITEIRDADALTERLYYLSKRQRSEQYNKFSANLPRLVTDANQLGNILRLLPADKIELTLKKKELQALIKSFEHIDSIIKKLDTEEQRIKLYKVLKSHPVLSGLSFAGVKEKSLKLSSQSTTVSSDPLIEEVSSPSIFTGDDSQSSRSDDSSSEPRTPVSTPISPITPSLSDVPVVEYKTPIPAIIEAQSSLSPTGTGPQRRLQPKPLVAEVQVVTVPPISSKPEPTITEQDTTKPIVQGDISSFVTSQIKSREGLQSSMKTTMRELRDKMLHAPSEDNTSEDDQNNDDVRLD